MRGLEDKQTANTTMDGQRIYYNFTSPHMSLDGKTPAEACGITVKGENKWKTLIQNASKKSLMSM